MPKDYAKRDSWNKQKKGKSFGKDKKHASRIKKKTPKRSKTPRKKGGRPWRLILLLIVLIVIIILAIAFLKRQTNQIVTSNTAVVKSAKSILVPLQAEKEVSQSAVLPANFVFQSGSTTPPASQGYRLQLGTYLPGEALTQLENKLTKKKFSYQQSEIIRLGTVYYRVLMGPYPNLTAAQAVQAELAAEKIYSVPVSYYP
ncbi:MAG: hypothetical protein A3E87_05310 [Gammaproteobacteria bacterium RIFCSPHIGHO2_12_FULL_35_23]|nr:MAG: hypothetical protein A3E87_05310 [Gammaproteobacteria bacterium RIFCSPHIGHO2_12_FULL_35_23]